MADIKLTGLIEWLKWNDTMAFFEDPGCKRENRLVNPTWNVE